MDKRLTWADLIPILKYLMNREMCCPTGDNVVRFELFNVHAELRMLDIGIGTSRMVLAMEDKSSSQTPAECNTYTFNYNHTVWMSSNGEIRDFAISDIINSTSVPWADFVTMIFLYYRYYPEALKTGYIKDSEKVQFSNHIHGCDRPNINPSNAEIVRSAVDREYPSHIHARRPRRRRMYYRNHNDNQR